METSRTVVQALRSECVERRPRRRTSRDIRLQIARFRHELRTPGLTSPVSLGIEGRGVPPRAPVDIGLKAATRWVVEDPESMSDPDLAGDRGRAVSGCQAVGGTELGEPTKIAARRAAGGAPFETDLTPVLYSGAGDHHPGVAEVGQTVVSRAAGTVPHHDVGRRSGEPPFWPAVLVVAVEVVSRPTAAPGRRGRRRLDDAPAGGQRQGDDPRPHPYARCQTVLLSHDFLTTPKPALRRDRPAEPIAGQRCPGGDLRRR